MKTYTSAELKAIIENHGKWMNDEEGAKHADLSGANLSDANLSGADLRYADLSGANLSDANLSGADLRYADLRGANLSDANLSGANLRDADLRGADLRYANLRDANLRDANLRDADLRGAAVHNVAGVKIVSIDNIGTYNGKATFLPSENKVWAGCWEGALEEFLVKGLEQNADNELQRKNIALAYEFFKNHVEEGSN